VLAQEVRVSRVSGDEDVTEANPADTVVFLGEPHDTQGHTQWIVLAVQALFNRRVNAHEPAMAA